MATSSSELVRELKQVAQQKLITSFLGTGIVGQTLAKKIAEKNKDKNDPVGKAMSEQNAVQTQVNSTAVKIEPIVRSIARTINILARVWAKHVYTKQEALRLQRERLTKERALAEEEENERKQAEQQAVQKETLTGTQPDGNKGGILGSIIASTNATKAFVKQAFKKLGVLLIGAGVGGAAAAYAMDVANDQQVSPQQTDLSSAPPPTNQPLQASVPEPGAQLQNAEPLSGSSSAPLPEPQTVAMGPSTPQSSPSAAVGGGSIPDNPAKSLPQLPYMEGGKILPPVPVSQSSVSPSSNKLTPVPTPQAPVVPEKYMWSPKTGPQKPSTPPAAGRPSIASTSEPTQTAEATTETNTSSEMPVPPGTTSGMMSTVAPPSSTTIAASQPERVIDTPSQLTIPPSVQTFISQVQQNTGNVFSSRGMMEI